MAQETVDIFETIAKGTVTLAELRDALSKAKDKLSELNVGEDKYQEKLKEVITLQNLVRGAMHGTTADIEDLSKAADGTAHSYNGLVNQMAMMKRELRNIDTSTAKGKKDFDDLAQKINAVNDELKKMDEQQGSFVRNVGNYTSGLKDLGQILKDFAPSLGGIAKGVDDVDKSVKLLGKQPILGIVGLLAPLLVKIADALKEDDSAMASVKKAMDALKPVTDFFAGILDKIIALVTDLIGRLSQFFTGNNIFQKLIQGVVGVGNAIAQFVIAPFKGIIAAVKVFQDEGIKGLRNAGKAFLTEMKSGVAFRANFEAGQAVADALILGGKSRKKDLDDAGKKTGEDLADKIIKSATEKMSKLFSKENKAWDKAQRKWKDDIAKLSEDINGDIENSLQKETDEIYSAFLDMQEGERIFNETTVKMAQEAAEKKMAIMSAYASGTSDLLNGIADLMESSGNADEKSVRMAKNLRIAAATIDMIQGAVTAYSTAQSLGPVAGPIVGALNAAAVVASGMANIAKIKATNVSKDSAPTASAPDTPATVNAPELATAVPTTTVVNGASTEAALNRASQPQRVYILQSDIEAADDAARVQVAEATF